MGSRTTSKLLRVPHCAASVLRFREDYSQWETRPCTSAPGLLRRIRTCTLSVFQERREPSFASMDTAQIDPNTLFGFAYQRQLSDRKTPCTLVIAPAVTGMLKHAGDVLEIVQFCQCYVRYKGPTWLARERRLSKPAVKLPKLLLAATQVQINSRAQRTEAANTAQLYRNRLERDLFESFHGVPVGDIHLARR